MKKRTVSSKGYEGLKAGDYLFSCNLYPTTELLTRLKPYLEKSSLNVIAIQPQYVTLCKDVIFIEGLGGLLVEGLRDGIARQLYDGGELLRVDLLPNSPTWDMHIIFRGKVSTPKGKKKA